MLAALTEGEQAWLMKKPMPILVGRTERAALQAYSRGAMTALELRRRLGEATYGEVLQLLRAEGLPLPRAPVEGREAQLARAREWLFPKQDG